MARHKEGREKTMDGMTDGSRGNGDERKMGDRRSQRKVKAVDGIKNVNPFPGKAERRKKTKFDEKVKSKKNSKSK